MYFPARRCGTAYPQSTLGKNSCSEKQVTAAPPKKALEYKHGKHFDCMTMDKDVVAADTSFRTYYY